MWLRMMNADAGTKGGDGVSDADLAAAEAGGTGAADGADAGQQQEADPDDEELSDDELYGEAEPDWIAGLREARGEPKFSKRLLKDPAVVQAAWKLRNGYRERMSKLAEREKAAEERDRAHAEAVQKFRKDERAFYEFFRSQGASPKEAKAEAKAAATEAQGQGGGGGADVAKGKGGGEAAFDPKAYIEERLQGFAKGMAARADELAAEEEKAAAAARYEANKTRLAEFAKTHPDYPAMRTAIRDLIQDDLREGKKVRPAEHYYFILKGQGKGGSVAVAGGAEKAAASKARTATATAQGAAGGAGKDAPKFSSKMTTEERAEIMADPKLRAAYYEWTTKEQQRLLG